MAIAVLQPGASALHLRGVIWTMNHAPDRAVIDPGIDRTPGREVRVVVQSTGDAARAAADVRAAGGTVGTQLSIVDGFAAKVPTSTLDRLGRSTSIKAVTLDRSATFNSYSFPSTQAPAVDPLGYAVERLWQLGIVVVGAAGNDGPNTGTITKPGDDPVVLTVGAYDDKQNIDPLDDSVPSWSSNGPTVQG